MNKNNIIKILSVVLFISAIAITIIVAGKFDTNNLNKQTTAKQTQTTKSGNTTTHVHNYATKGETVEPTPTEDGYTIYICSCGATTKGDWVEKLGETTQAQDTNVPETTKAAETTKSAATTKTTQSNTNNDSSVKYTKEKEGSNGWQVVCGYCGWWADRTYPSCPNCGKAWVPDSSHWVCKNCGTYNRKGYNCQGCFLYDENGKYYGFSEQDAIRFKNEIEAYATTKGYTIDHSLPQDNSTRWGATWGIGPGSTYEEQMARAKQDIDSVYFSQGSWHTYINVIYYSVGEGEWEFLPITS